MAPLGEHMIEWTAHRLYAALGYARLPERDWTPFPGITLRAYAKDLAS